MWRQLANVEEKDMIVNGDNVRLYLRRCNKQVAQNLLICNRSELFLIAATTAIYT